MSKVSLFSDVLIDEVSRMSGNVFQGVWSKFASGVLTDEVLQMSDNVFVDV